MLSLLRISLDFLEVTFFSFVFIVLPARLTPCSVSKNHRIATLSNTMLYSTLFYRSYTTIFALNGTSFSVFLFVITLRNCIFVSKTKMN